MFNVASIIAFIRALGPTVYLLAAAYRYGRQKYGDGSWKTQSTLEHIDRANEDLLEWKSGTNTEKPYLIDAALRLAFAVSTAVASGVCPGVYPKK